MKHHAIRLIVALLTFAIGLISTTLLQGSRFNAVPNGKVEQEIMQVEREYIQAHLDGNTTALDNILADDFAFGNRRRVENKAQRLALLETPGFGFDAINTSNVQVEVNGDSATVTGEAYTLSFHYDLKSTSQKYRFKRHYEKRDGRWQLIWVRVGR
ncbi:MAG: nuclear transport factor 2 family protein [Acidobacteria bacterium]|nr:nuclear transport factor 2 family protein [Acidobacteriota bacterium]